jgi:rod shape-determining protein MreD
MSGSRSLVVALLVVLLVALQYTLRPILDWRASVDFLVIAVLLVAVRVRPGTAAVVGFLVGLVSDALTPEAFGAGALAMTLVGFTASQLKATFFADNVLLNAVFVFVGKVAFDAIFLVSERRLDGLALVAQLLLWTPLAALLTAVVGLVVMALARPTLERRRA